MPLVHRSQLSVVSQTKQRSPHESSGSPKHVINNTEEAFTHHHDVEHTFFLLRQCVVFFLLKKTRFLLRSQNSSLATAIINCVAYNDSVANNFARSGIVVSLDNFLCLVPAASCVSISHGYLDWPWSY